MPNVHWGSFIAGALIAIALGYVLQKRRVAT